MLLIEVFVGIFFVIFMFGFFVLLGVYIGRWGWYIVKVLGYDIEFVVIMDSVEEFFVILYFD